MVRERNETFISCTEIKTSKKERKREAKKERRRREGFRMTMARHTQSLRASRKPVASAVDSVYSGNHAKAYPIANGTAETNKRVRERVRERG